MTAFAYSTWRTRTSAIAPPSSAAVGIPRSWIGSSLVTSVLMVAVSSTVITEITWKVVAAVPDDLLGQRPGVTRSGDRHDHRPVLAGRGDADQERDERVTDGAGDVRVIHPDHLAVDHDGEVVRAIRSTDPPARPLTSYSASTAAADSRVSRRVVATAPGARRRPSAG